MAPVSRIVAVLVAASMVGACSSSGDAEPQSGSTSTAPVATTTTIAPTTTTTAPVTTTTSTTPIEVPEPMPPLAEDGWELVWQDEFDGDAIDPAKWAYDIGGWGWGNGEGQYYTDRPENARIEQGLLVIEARQERYEEKYYTSARLKTQGLAEFQYGRIEARIKVPAGSGLWPAFWMLGADFERDESNPIDSNWPFVGEIDIMEHVGREPNLVVGTVHGPGYSGAGGLGKWNPRDEPIADEFHTYAIEWDEAGIRWFYDGEEYWFLGPEGVGEREWVFDRPFFMLLNLAVGGSFPGPVSFSLEFPVYMFVDHVRVYQRTDTGS
jgi:beta-glucanase (GH16 family)